MKRSIGFLGLWTLGLLSAPAHSLIGSPRSDSASPLHDRGTPSTSVKIPPSIADSGQHLPGLRSSNDDNDFGPNAFLFDPSMSTTAIQSQVNATFQTQQSNQFGPERYAFLFMPGSYSLDIQVGFYTTVHGLGTTPDAVKITGGVNVLAAWFDDNATQNFWRGIENLAIAPTVFGNNSFWATSQATWLRRVHVNGTLWLFDIISQGPNNWSSGGFIADSVIDIGVQSGSQQQYLTRNTELTNWQGHVWNMVFVGDLNPPTGNWLNQSLSIIKTTPVIREKPYLTSDGANFSIVVPPLKTSSQGPSWTATEKIENCGCTEIALTGIYVAVAGVDNSTTINLALQRGYHLLLTPGVYQLDQPIVVRNANTVVLGIGIATLQPTSDSPVLIVDDVDGVTVAGILLDAGQSLTPNLIQIGGVGSNATHSTNPTAIFDVSCRVGGAVPTAKTTSCMVINSNDVIIDNVWLWRADHGAQSNFTGWDINPASNGLIVNGNNVVAYGLFVEHFEEFQTLWNGDGGSVYFYQSECPYDVPSQAAWTQGGQNGFPSYKVGSSVKSHKGEGIGVYSNFYNVVHLENAIETPTGSGIEMNHLITVWLNGNNQSAIDHIINGMRAGATRNHTISQSPE